MDNVNEIFAKNLKRERENAGFTQKELAEKIGYSEKSISKWESGRGLPGIDILVTLCYVLGTRPDEFIYKHSESEFFLGINGESTKTHFLLADEAGNVVKEVFGGASNPIDIGMKNAQNALRKGIREVCAGYPFSHISMFAGISGGLTGNCKMLLSDFFVDFGFKKAENGTDVQNSVALGLGEGDGILVIMGIGVAGVAVKNGEKKRMSGWGQLFDTGGSAYNLGRDAMVAVMHEFDGIGIKTVMTQIFERRLGGTIKSRLGSIYRGGKSYIASFADVVFEAADSGDIAANEIIEANMCEVARMIDAGAELIGVDNIKVVLTGGVISGREELIQVIQKHLKTTLTCNFSIIRQSPAYGALLIARGKVQNSW